MSNQLAQQASKMATNVVSDIIRRSTLTEHFRDSEIGTATQSSVLEALTPLVTRIQWLETSLVSHFQREHIEGEGRELDRWRTHCRALKERLEELERSFELGGRCPHGCYVTGTATKVCQHETATKVKDS